VGKGSSARQPGVCEACKEEGASPASLNEEVFGGGFNGSGVVGAGHEGKNGKSVDLQAKSSRKPVRAREG
jgi:hypothetical protein